MTKDIGPILEGWDYNHNEITVRRIKGVDGREKIQMRIDLGLIQMEVDGRPDGSRPYGHESLLEHYRTLAEEHRKRMGTQERFRLDTEDCVRLQQEAIQYYHRYLSFFQLEDYPHAVRDTERNLRLFDFIKQYADDDDARMAFEQYRPYVIMMNTRARGSLALERKDYDRVLQLIDQGIQRIQRFHKESEQNQLIDVSREIAFLEHWAETIQQMRPLSRRERLEQELDTAIQTQEYERAAQIRDELRDLKDTS